MKVEKLLELIGDIDDSFVAEATHGKHKLSKMPWGLMATAACLCLMIASVVFLRSAGLLPVAPITTDPTETTTQPLETTQPTETTVPSETTQPTETTQPSVTVPEVPEELAHYNELFGNYQSWYNRALVSEYETPQQIRLIDLFYSGFPGETTATDEEWAALKDQKGFNEMYDFYRLPVSKMNEVLTEYLGITVADVEDSGFAGLTYLESTNCYYFMTTSARIADFSAQFSQELPDGSIRVYYDGGYKGDMVVTLQPNGDGYRILSNVKASEIASDLSTDWIVEEDTSITGEITFGIPLKGKRGMDAMIAAFNEVYPGIKILLHTYSTNIDSSTSINAAIVAGEVDVMASFGLRATYMRWDNGLFYDLTELVEQESIDLAAQWGTDAYTYDDKVYSFPCGGLSNYIAVNMNAWNEAGLGELPAEWTWDEYLDACRKMTKLDENGNTIVYGGSDNHATGSNWLRTAYDNFMFAHCQVEGGDIFYDKDGTSSYDSPIVLEQLQRKLEAELVDGIWYPSAQHFIDRTNITNLFCDATAASVICSKIAPALGDEDDGTDVAWVTGFAPYPTMEEGQKNYMSGVMPEVHAGICAFIEEEKLPAAWAFLKWFSTYGSKYLTVAGYQSTWRGTDNSELLPLIYGSEEEAAKWVDVESFERVVGRTDLPFCAETTLTAYSDVSSALSEPMMKAINGEITAEECLKQALEEAEKAIKDNE